jgi:protein-L-isoaspartate(D-aspartate) O-methyltransferase
VRHSFKAGGNGRCGAGISGLLLAAALMTATFAVSSCARAQAQAPDMSRQRNAMVDMQIVERRVSDRDVLAAMRKIPRHRFVPPDLASRAYDDTPLPIGHGQTISQPYIVAYMSELLEVERTHRVLEIGSGSGYQAAVLGELARDVYTIEIVPELASTAAAVLKALNYTNVHVRNGDGYAGWPERAPFDRILVTAAPEEVPAPLVEQLAVGGRLVAPVGGQNAQWITVIQKTASGVAERRTIPVRFVPFVRQRP